MEKDDFDKKVIEAKELHIRSALKNADDYEKDREMLGKLHAICAAAGSEYYSQIRLVSFHLQNDFSLAERLMKAAEHVGIELEAWETHDYPQQRNRDFTVKLPSGNLFSIAIYLSQEAKCRVVEVSRRPGDDIVETRLECGDPDDTSQDL